MSLSTEFRFHHAPGTVGAPIGPAVRVACGDKYIQVKTVFYQGKYRDAGEVLPTAAVDLPASFAR
jgi:hypothetical protein